MPKPSKDRPRRSIQNTNWFRAAFICVECETEVTVNVRQAVVDSQTGARCECPKCHKAYRVTRGGATPIDPNQDVAFVDAEGNPYKYPSRKDENNATDQLRRILGNGSSRPS